MLCNQSAHFLAGKNDKPDKTESGRKGQIAYVIGAAKSATLIRPSFRSRRTGSWRQLCRDLAEITTGSASFAAMLASDTGTLQQAKLVLLGDMGAGKSSLVLRFVKGQFFEYQVLAANFGD